jgi:membrane associated rhomboid family serine protease
MKGVTGALIVANLLVFALQVLYGDALLVPFALWPVGDQLAPELGTAVGFRPWQLVTYAFLHGGFTHLFLNMFALWMFGRDCEAVLGSRRFLAMYAAAVLTAALVQLAVASASGDAYPTVGASGGVFGVLLAFGMLFPRRRVLLLIPPIPMPAWLFVTLYGVIELASGVLGTAAGVAHFAHLGGMAGAYLLLRSWAARPG